jgi:hypothetical protein
MDDDSNDDPRIASVLEGCRAILRHEEATLTYLRDLFLAIAQGRVSLTPAVAEQNAAGMEQWRREAHNLLDYLSRIGVGEAAAPPRVM